MHSKLNYHNTDEIFGPLIRHLLIKITASQIKTQNSNIYIGCYFEMKLFHQSNLLPVSTLIDFLESIETIYRCVAPKTRNGDGGK